MPAHPAPARLELDFAPWRLSGLVLAPLLNDLAALQALGAAAHAAPYLAPPRAPVLYIKPRNTLAAAAAAMALPPRVPALRMGASLALVIGRTACRVSAAQALAHVAGVALVADLGVPHDSYYRPAVRCNAIDGSCRIAPPVPLRGLDPDALTLQVDIDGVCRQQVGPGGRVRAAAALVADVSEFMTLRPGDLLLLGVAAGAPLAGAGQAVRLWAPGVGAIEFAIEAALEAELEAAIDPAIEPVIEPVIKTSRGPAP